MKIAVLVKQVPDTASKIEVLPDHSGVQEGGLKFVMSPYDEFAVEAAIQLKEAQQADTTVITMGGAKSVETLRTALAMGIEKAIHIDAEGQTLDSYAVATVLAKVIKEKGFDLVFCGKQATDLDNSQVGPMIAELLDWPHISIVEGFSFGDQQATITRRVSGGGKEIYQTPLPVLIGCEKGLNTPRYASLPGIMKAKSKPVEALKAGAYLGDVKALVVFRNYQAPAERVAGKKLEGDVAEQARELVRLLRIEAKVI